MNNISEDNCMLWEIIKKELLENILTARNVALYSIIMLLGFANILFSLRNFNNNKLAYESYLKNSEENISQVSLSIAYASVFTYTISRRNSVLSFINSEDYHLPNELKFSMFRFKEINTTRKGNVFLINSYDLDWIFIIGIILSFFALVLSFDCINGEKNKKTLSLIMANSISRLTFILSKLISRFLLLYIPFLTVFIICLLLFQFWSGLSFNFNHYFQIGLFLLASALYILTFLLIGIVGSTITNDPQKSIIILLLLWFIIIIIMPAIGKTEIFALSPTMSKNKYEQMLKTKEIEYELLDRKMMKREIADRVRVENEYYNFADRHFISYIENILDRISNTKNVLKISPYCTFKQFTESITNTGITNFEIFFENAKVYKSILRDFLINEDKKDFKSGHLFTENTGYFRVSNKAFAISTFPRFEIVNKETYKYNIKAILDLLILVICLICSYCCSIIIFYKKDLR